MNAELVSEGGLFRIAGSINTKAENNRGWNVDRLTLAINQLIQRGTDGEHVQLSAAHTMGDPNNRTRHLIRKVIYHDE